MKNKSIYDIAIVGATGAVGQKNNGCSRKKEFSNWFYKTIIL